MPTTTMSSIELPNEVWVDVMSSLNYSELKTCERVSKSFQALILNAPALAKIVFRSRRVLGSMGDMTSTDGVKLHPVFCVGMEFSLPYDRYPPDVRVNDIMIHLDTLRDDVSYGSDGPPAGVMLPGDNYFDYHHHYAKSTKDLLNLAVAEEYATEPPLNVLRVRVGDGFREETCEAKALDGSGVTVLQAMEAVLRHWNSIDGLSGFPSWHSGSEATANGKGRSHSRMIKVAWF